MTGYVRKDTTNNIADGNVINAADLDAEFDGVQDAFNASTGHKHDGTAGEGATINALGPTQDVTISAVLVAPKTTNTVDIGSNSLKFKDLFLAGNGSVGGTLAVTGVATLTAQPILSSLTASRAVFTDGSKGLVSNAITGTGNVVMSASPTLTGTIGGENATLSGTLGVTGVATFTAQPILSSLTASRAVFSDGSKGLVSNAITGTGNVVMSASPTLTGTIDAAALTASGNVTLSGGTANGVAYLNGSKVLTSGSALTFDGTSLTFGSTSQRIIGDMSNATQASRLLAQTSTANTSTSFGVIPNGSSGVSQFAAYGASDPTNTQRMRIGVDSASAYLISDITGTGSYLPLTFSTNGSEQMRLTSTGLGIGTSSPSRKLHISASGSNCAIRIDNTVSGRPVLLVYDDSQNLTLTNSSDSGYFAYVNGTGAGTERFRIDSSGNLGLGVTPSAWSTSVQTALQVYTAGVSGNGGGNTASRFTHGCYLDGSTWKYQYTGVAPTRYEVVGANAGSTHSWSIAAGGTAGNAITFTQAMTLDASGRLGVGQTSPSAKLDILSTSGTTAIFKDSARYALVSIQSSGTNQDAYLDFAPTGTGSAVFQVSSVERARIDSSGNLGVGTTSPSTYGRIVSSGGTISLVTDTASQRRLSFYSTSNGTSENAYIQVQNDGATTNTGQILFATKNSGGTLAERARISAEGVVAINPAGGGSGTMLLITGGGFNPQGAIRIGDGTVSSQTNYWDIGRDNFVSGAFTFSNNGSERVRIDTSGNLLVGTTSGNSNIFKRNTDSASASVRVISATATTSNQYGISCELNGDPNNSTNYFIANRGGVDGTTDRCIIRSNGGIANYSANDVNLSDRREKTNFAPSKSYLNVICAIPVQTFNYINQNMEDDGGLTLGVVAQDVQAVAPELVMESNWAADGQDPKMRLSIYQTDLQYALMKCIQEQQAIIESLKARLDAANL